MDAFIIQATSRGWKLVVPCCREEVCTCFGREISNIITLYSVFRSSLWYISQLKQEHFYLEVDMCWSFF